MPVTFRTSTRVEARPVAPPDSPAPRRPLRALGGAALIAGLLFLLYFQRDFGLYAFTGLFWQHADGIVVSTYRTSKPAVEFFSADNAIHTFNEDYIRLCGGRRSFCFIRTFTKGQQVPVVYPPWAADHAYIHDWALFANAASWCLEALIALLFAWAIPSLLGRRSRSISFQYNSAPEIE